MDVLSLDDELGLNVVLVTIVLAVCFWFLMWAFSFKSKRASFAFLLFLINLGSEEEEISQEYPYKSQ